MISLLVNFLIIFIIFQNILFNLFEFPSYLQYWDEFLFLIIVIFGLIYGRFNRTKKIYGDHLVILSLIIYIVLIGILGNISFSYAYSTGAIFRDIIGFLKFPLTFVMLKINGLDKKISMLINQKTIEIIKFCSFIIFLLGIFSLFFNIGLSQNSIRHGINPYQFLFSHPTYLVTSCVIMLSLIEYYDNKKNKNLFEIFIIITIILAMRTKGFAFVGAFAFIKYSKNFFNNHKVLTLIFLSIIIIFIGYEKVTEYMSYTSSAREVLYIGSLTLMEKCFPFGSGFATYASHLSGKYWSNVYDFINIPFDGYEGSTMAVLGDTGYPYYIGQFGLIGMILLVFMIIKIIKIINLEKNKKSALFIGIYIIICLTSESLLIGNGFEFGILLAIFSSKSIINSNMKGES